MNSLKLFISVLFSCFIFSSFAQKSGGSDNIKTFKIAFITKRLDLTSDQAEKFRPVYNKYQEELTILKERNNKLLLNVYLNIESMSDEEMNKFLDDEIIFRQNELDLLKRYVSQFKAVLPVRKVLKLFKAEEDFKLELIHRAGQNKR